MTAAAEHAPVPGGHSFADASPAQVRAALIPEEAAEFDRDWREVMDRATRSLDLSEVLATLDAWRRVAWMTVAGGPERHRSMLAGVEERMRTGERRPGAVTWAELRADLRPEG